jgi:hypothetical protein
MMSSLSRRRLLAATVPGLLAGCLVESGESAEGEAATGAETGGSGTAEAAESDGSDAEEVTESGGSGDGESEASGADSPAEQTDDEPVSDAVGPDGAGLVVRSAEVSEVTVGTYDTTVDARLVVENAGRFTYGTVELRVDTYATVPSSPERDPVGFAYVTERFPSDDRFDDGTRWFDVSISFRSRETSARPDPEWYEVDAAVRRAESV